jgi:hypothetical protein
LVFHIGVFSYGNNRRKGENVYLDFNYQPKMNRLILIGNGFDLAHGMKTSYNDFILWYLKKCFEEADKVKQQYI